MVSIHSFFGMSPSHPFLVLSVQIQYHTIGKMWKANKKKKGSKKQNKHHQQTAKPTVMWYCQWCTIAFVYAYQKHHIQNVYNSFKQIYWHILYRINLEAINGTMAIAF